MKLQFRIGEKHSDGTYVAGDQADAHEDGTICFRTTKDISLELIIHELAHIQPDGMNGHSTGWWSNYLPMLKGLNPEREKFWRSQDFLKDIP